LGCDTPGPTPSCLCESNREETRGADRIKKLPRIKSAEPVIRGVLKIVFLDGYARVVDLRPLIAKSKVSTWVKVSTWLQDPGHFAALRVEEYGHAISWIDSNGYEIDLGADSRRRDCERQAEIHKLMVN
jgi:hypothetical protein